MDRMCSSYCQGSWSTMGDYSSWFTGAYIQKTSQWPKKHQSKRSVAVPSNFYSIIFQEILKIKMFPTNQIKANKTNKQTNKNIEKVTKGCIKCLMSLRRDMNSIRTEALCAPSCRIRQESVPFSNGTRATELYLPAQSLWEVSRSRRAYFWGY